MNCMVAASVGPLSAGLAGGGALCCPHAAMAHPNAKMGVSRYFIFIVQSFLWRSAWPSARPPPHALLHVADLSVGEGHLHVLVVEDRFPSQVGHLERLPETSCHLIHGLANGDRRRRSIGRRR